MYGRAVFLTPEPVLNPDPDPDPDPEPDWTHLDRRICCIGSAKCCARVHNPKRTMGPDESQLANHTTTSMGISSVQLLQLRRGKSKLACQT